MSNISDSIAANALKPASVSVDGQSVTARSAADQIAADKHVSNVAVRNNPFSALKHAKLVPPGAV